MKKRIVILVALMAALLLVAGPVYATPPTPVEGTLEYTFEITDERWANGHWFFEATEWEDWAGDFEGTGVSFFRVVWFSYPSGPLNVWLRCTFTGTVHYDGLDKEGTMVIQYVGWRYLPEDWYGRWVILSGTDELANLRGRGTWGGPGFGATGPDIWYSGKIHFEPN